MKYFEMYGLPGAGKTTISVPVIQKLREEGYKVADLSNVYFHNCEKGHKSRVWLEILLSIKDYPLYYSVARYGIFDRGIKGGVKYKLKLLFLIHQLAKIIEESKFDVILCEEGILQYLSSLSFTNELPDNKSLKRLFSCIKKKVHISAVSCEIGIEDSFDRINNRGETSRRFSSNTSPSLLLSALKAKKHNLEVLSKYVSTICVLSMMDSMAENEAALYGFIKAEINNGQR